MAKGTVHYKKQLSQQSQCIMVTSNSVIKLDEGYCSHSSIIIVGPGRAKESSPLGMSWASWLSQCRRLQLRERDVPCTACIPLC